MNHSLFDIEKGFQTSVNIGYDLNNPKKISSLIPTTEAIRLAEDIIVSTSAQSTKRARFLIGAYGKGKSHIVLVILSLLCCKDKSMFANFLEKVKAYNPNLYDFIESYLDSKKKLLPVVIDGNSNSMTQSFLGALHKTLVQNGLSDIMPTTHFKAALHMINLWEKKFPHTYKELQANLDQPISSFVMRLKQYDVHAYETFNKLYPTLTAGSEFNPFSGFSVVDIYDSVNQQLAHRGYQGIYVVYDEFSKYLEANITSTTAGDVKMLQDFAEKCNRSGAQQLHLLMILHKEIENYIDKLPKHKVDGWRGVSERFAHVLLHNDYSQVYGIIAHAIKKHPIFWSSFVKENNDFFSRLFQKYQGSLLFKECTQKELEEVIYGCYPLHPSTSFILPRLSEKVAQNERTMFTFIAGDEHNTLPYLLENCRRDFFIVTPDALYDYFAPQMKKAIYDSEINGLYNVAARILEEHQLSELEEKIIKTILLIYVLSQFNKLTPTVEVIDDIYQGAGYSREEIKEAIEHLIKDQCIVYLKRSNAYLRLKVSSGIHIFDEIKKIQNKRNGISYVELLNEMNPFPYEYPNRYNDTYDMVRYFTFKFISSENVGNLAQVHGATDGMIFGVLPKDEEELQEIRDAVQEHSKNVPAAIFAVPRHYEEMESACREYDAVSFLRQNAIEDAVLFEEYDVVYQDLSAVIERYISEFSHPEAEKVDYYYRGIKQRLYRKSNLSDLMSFLCEERFPKTPVINNETLNKNKLTAVAINSRAKLLHGLIQNFQVPNLGLTGSGQEVSFLRSALINTGVLKNVDSTPYLNIDSCDTKLSHVLHIIKDFIDEAHTTTGRKLSVLYEMLSGDNEGIGLRRGVIPIYLAVVMKQYKGHVYLSDPKGEVSFSAETLQKIDDHPEDYTIRLDIWNQEKEAYVKQLSELFERYLLEKPAEDIGYDYIIVAMNRWYLSLPKYVKESRKVYIGHGAFAPLAKENLKFLSIFRQIGIGAQKILFDKIPSVFSDKCSLDEIFENIQKIKGAYDSLEDELYNRLILEVKDILMPGRKLRGTLEEVCQEWMNSISTTAKTYLYSNGAERLIQALSQEKSNDYQVINHLVIAITGLTIDDWNDETVLSFIKKLSLYAKTIQEYAVQRPLKDDSVSTEPMVDSYEVQFIDDKGHAMKKVFPRQEYSKRAKLLYNDIESSMEEMGQSITTQEKRQVLMDLLTKLL